MKIEIINGHYYQHRDGGIYRVLDMVRYSDRDEAGVAYIHCWPFDAGIWVRPLAEFEDGRFQLMADDEAGRIMNTVSAEVGQEMVNAAKKRRKG